MARKRMIAPNFWASEDVSKLTVFECLLFLGMISNADDAGKATTVRLWAALFEEDDPLPAANAVRALIVTDERSFPPHIGAVKTKMRQLTAPPTVTALEAWRQIRQAISRCICDAAGLPQQRRICR